ncbi:hypothetical protein PHJA_002375000 [Phtheirospermum japonicum]|uniref:Uncharacterized protein n=1 Tax=Phtheirospermum japonicum TaxID=374723 RepID=A0A830CTG1_9LAMI|nr:hypothetical protein PHJA_002375000 [Phtheirospermum japonicum]
MPINDIITESAESDCGAGRMRNRGSECGKLCDWFLKDKLKREQNLDSAVFQWDDSEFML